MKRATVVIGSNWGDEGKGLVTDFHAHRLGRDTIVVRFNGGAQAGHTVVTPEGKRHVFSHFGSGTLAGCPTYLSEHFIVNPLLWQKEHAELAARFIQPMLYVNPHALVTTPHDMMLNQLVEKRRGHRRHGSCGVGINETILRAHEYPITFGQIADSLDLKRRLDLIFEGYVRQRLERLGLDPEDMLPADGMIPMFLQCCESLKRNAFEIDHELLRTREQVVFEGAQGLLLDKNSFFFPHVTPSNTGLHNVIEIAHACGIEGLDVAYVTRAYMTRHGAGPFPSELPATQYPDGTNEPNPWQGHMRFGALDVDLLVEAIGRDLAFADDIDVNAHLAVTCLDQTAAGSPVLVDNDLKIIARSDLLHLLQERTGLGVGLISFGPTRADVKTFEVPA